MTGNRKAFLLMFALGTTPLVAHAQLEAGIPVGSMAPAVTVPDLDGKPFDFGTVLGKKPAFIEFWASWCENCEALLPKLKAVHARYGNRVAWIGVNVTVNQSESRVRRYLETHAPPFMTLWDAKGVAVRAYLAPATSFVVVVDSGGTVVYTGSGGDQDLEAAIKKVFPTKAGVGGRSR